MTKHFTTVRLTHWMTNLIKTCPLFKSKLEINTLCWTHLSRNINAFNSHRYLNKDRQNISHRPKCKFLPFYNPQKVIIIGISYPYSLLSINLILNIVIFRLQTFVWFYNNINLLRYCCAVEYSLHPPSS